MRVILIVLVICLIAATIVSAANGQWVKEYGKGTSSSYVQ